MSLTDEANTKRAQEIIALALAIANTSDSETERALAAMLTATAEEIIEIIKNNLGRHNLDT